LQHLITDLQRHVHDAAMASAGMLDAIGDSPIVCEGDLSPRVFW
jgi:hypothetical protein